MSYFHLVQTLNPGQGNITDAVLRLQLRALLASVLTTQRGRASWEGTYKWENKDIAFLFVFLVIFNTWYSIITNWSPYFIWVSLFFPSALFLFQEPAQDSTSHVLLSSQPPLGCHSFSDVPCFWWSISLKGQDYSVGIGLAAAFGYQKRLNTVSFSFHSC